MCVLFVCCVNLCSMRTCKVHHPPHCTRAHLRGGGQGVREGQQATRHPHRESADRELREGAATCAAWCVCRMGTTEGCGVQDSDEHREESLLWERAQDHCESRAFHLDSLFEVQIIYKAVKTQTDIRKLIFPHRLYVGALSHP